jgi:hypothetical protein
MIRPASKPLALLALLALSSLTAGVAEAGVLAAVSRVNNPFTFSFASGSSPVPVALDDVGNTAVTFFAPVAGTVAITYSVECSTSFIGSTPPNHLSTIVLVDGVAANGDGGSRYTRLCRASNSAEVATRTVYRSVAAGNHTVQVLAIIEGSSSFPFTGRLEKGVLTVVN